MNDTIENLLDNLGHVETMKPKDGGGNAKQDNAAGGDIKHRFNLVPFNKVILAVTAAYLVRGIIPREGLVVIWGPPKCGKTFWCLDLVMHIVLGWEYRGRRVRQGPVVYVACEGERGLNARVAAFRKHHGLEGKDAAFYLVTSRLNLTVEYQTLVEDIKAQLPAGVIPSALVIDTLNRSIEGSESSDEDMGKYIKATDAVREAFKCAVLVIHHCGIVDTRPRGHTSLTGAVDAQIAVRRDGGDFVSATVEYLKDGPDGAEGARTTSRLESVNLGNDNEGQENTSCVIVATDRPAPVEQPKLSRNQQTMLAMLHAATGGSLAVEDWNELARAEGIGKKRKADLYDIRKALKDKDLAYEYGGRWYAKK